MKPWDSYTHDFGEAGRHPAVIVSHPDRVANALWVNVLFRTIQRTHRPPKETEEPLNRNLLSGAGAGEADVGHGEAGWEGVWGARLIVPGKGIGAPRSPAATAH